MPISRKFLGLEKPALQLAADHLLQQAGGGSGEADLRHTVVVTPGGRAGRRLLEILVQRCETAGTLLIPPQIVTVGRLPELLYPRKRPFAGELVQQLAWADALRSFDRQKLSRVLAQLPDNSEHQRWLDLARMLQILHRELASDGLDFAHVAERGRKLASFSETERWQIFAAIQQDYLRTLDAQQLWDRQTARLYAIQHRECRLDRPLYLIAAVDLNRSMRRMLDQVGDRVTALVYASPSHAERFDRYGCLVPEQWAAVDLQIPDQTLLTADDPRDQAEVVARRIASFDERYRSDELTIGLPDESLAPQLVQQLDECGLNNRFGAGQPLSQSSVVRLLQDLAVWLESQRFAGFATLARHPDLESWWMQRGVQPGWIEQLDDYYNRHLPVHIDQTWLGEQHGCERLAEVHDHLVELVRPLCGEPAELKEWLPPIRTLLLEVYGARTFDLDDETSRAQWQACRTVQETLEEMSGIPEPLAPQVTAGAALNLLLAQLRSQRVAPVAWQPAIELVGWLELPLDDAPALIVTTMNEGFVPSNLNSDLFLPGALRSTLGLDDNARRYARDAYAVSTLVAPWRDVSFVVGRRTADDDPLAPSRLLFAADEPTIAARALKFFDEAARREVRPPISGGLTAGQRDLVFEPPRAEAALQPITRMNVTSFSAYLACPYRFYLTQVLGLRRIDDNATELDGRAFGNLAHHTLEAFGGSDVRDSDNAEEIRDTLYGLLARIVLERFGSSPGSSVLIQVEQLKMRLKAFAAWQADRRKEGWRIEHSELSFLETPGQLDVDGQPMLLTGRIDRIDVHQETGRQQILDYKTADSGESPDTTHRRRNGDWINLQLPLYRHLLRSQGMPSAVDLGYVVLPKSVSKVGLALAPWTDAELESADKAAESVVRGVRDQIFWPPADPPPPFSDDVAYLCLDGVFGH